MLFNKNANEIFLEKDSVDLFFMNPPYLGADLKKYGGEPTEYISFAESTSKYIGNMVPLAKHIEHSLKDNGSAFIMLRNDPNLGLVKFCNMISENTQLRIGKLFVWDFSKSTKVENLSSETMAVIVHLYKGSNFVNNGNIQQLLEIEFDPAEVSKYDDLGYTNAALPEKLYEYFIKTFSKPDDTVADILGGTGTIIRPAVKLGRNFIYNDLSASQYAIAQARFRDLIFEYL
jgi:DNA modification methylase